MAGTTTSRATGTESKPKPVASRALILARSGKASEWWPNRFASRLVLRAHVREAGPVVGNEYQRIMMR